MRSALSGFCGLLAALLLPLALVSVWLHTVVADTGEYLTRVEPLAGEARVRDAVEDVLVEELLRRVDLGALAEREGVDAGAVEELVRRVVAAVVAGDTFAAGWRTAQRAGHSEVVSALSSADPLPAGKQVVVPLDALVGAVRDRVDGLGPAVAGTLDGLSLALPIGSTADFEIVRVAYQVLERLWLLLPVAAVALALVSVATARRRLRAIAVLGGLASALCLALLAAMGVGRGLLLDTSSSRPVRMITGRMADVLSADLREAAVFGVLLGAAVLVVAAALGLLVRAVRRTVAG